MKLSEIRPTKKEREDDLKLAKSIVRRIKRLGREAMLVGSLAKDTNLRGDADLDIFILFPKRMKRENLEKEGLDIGTKVCGAYGAKPEKHYAEHPYIHSKIEGHAIDIVPCYKLKKGDRIISAVDRTPLHTEYVLRNLKNPNDVRKLKKFMKLVGVYGANIETNGFSGYLCELLVLKYGSFKNALKAAANWHEGTRIEMVESKAKFKEPLTVIDPTDARRNVAAAVSEENYCTFITLARAYIEKGHMPVKRKLLPGRGKLFAVEWKIGDENEEIIWSQLQRFEKKVRKALVRREFGVIDSWVWTDCCSKAQLLVELEVWELPAVNDWPGPCVYDRVHAGKFIEKYGKIVVRGNRVVTERKREFRTAKAYLKQLLKQPPSHLDGAKFTIKEGAAAKKTEAFKGYSTKFWVLR